MCLRHSISETNKLLLQGKKEIIVYKLLKRLPTDTLKEKVSYESPFFYKPYKNGWVKANFIDNQIPKLPIMDDTTISEGIHVFRTIKDAKDYVLYVKWKGLKQIDGNRIIIPAKALIKDLIGCNKTELVFSKIYINLPKDNGKAWSH